MSLTKKHFASLANILARHADPALVTEIADWCEKENPGFDRMKFLTAIGLELTDDGQPRYDPDSEARGDVPIPARKFYQ